VNGHLFVAPGDITQLSADAIAYSANSHLGRDGNLYSAFQANVPAFAGWYDGLCREHGRRCGVGDAFWLTLDPARRPHGLVLVVSTGGSSAVPDRAGRAVRAALTTAVQRLREELGRTGRLLIALPTFRVGQGGDRRQRLQSARDQVAAALEVLGRHADVDAAFVPYTATLHQIFLEARREVLGAPADGPRYPELEAALRAGECVLFVGAGLSSGAGLPDWNGLVRRLSEELGLRPGPRLDYLDLAQWYRERFGPPALAEVIRQTFGGAPLPTLGHYLLMSLPVRHVITTNYDGLLERALAALKRHPVKVVRQEDVARTGQAGVYVVKLHGDASRPEEVVVSRDDYDEFFQRRPAMALLLEGLLLNQTFFFVGYGLRDPNFRQVYHRIARMLREARRPAFATTFEAGGDSGAYLTRQWRHKQMHLIPIPGDSHAEQEQQFLRFLDRLSDQVTMSRPQLLLAPDVQVSPALAPLRGLLVDRVGAEMAALGPRDLAAAATGAEVRYLAEVLAFLTDHGWRPAGAGGWDLCRLWEYLAGHTADAGERRRLLVAALGAAEAFADVRRIRERLAESEGA
jgi:O-acetyl-ADP-ribose deacetylase (regulator of RNase III)